MENGIAPLNRIRQVPLLDGETPAQFFVPDAGIAERPPSNGDLLALTNKRVFLFRQSEGRREASFAPLDTIQGVCIREGSRHLKPVYQGLSLVLLGILAYLVLGSISDGAVIAAFLGGAIAFLGLLLLLRYFAWEAGGEIIFQGSSWELSFPFYGRDAGVQSHLVAHRFFQIREGEPLEASPPEPSAFQAPLPSLDGGDGFWLDPPDEAQEIFSPELEQGLHPFPDPTGDPGPDESSRTLLP